MRWKERKEGKQGQEEDEAEAKVEIVKVRLVREEVLVCPLLLDIVFFLLARATFLE